MENLEEIAAALRDDGVPFDAEHAKEVTAVIDGLDLRCPSSVFSGLDFNVDGDLGQFSRGYSVLVEVSGNVFVVEDYRNHDTRHDSINLPYVRHKLTMLNGRFVILREFGRQFE